METELGTSPGTHLAISPAPAPTSHAMQDRVLQGTKEGRCFELPALLSFFLPKFLPSIEQESILYLWNVPQHKAAVKKIPKLIPDF